MKYVLILLLIISTVACNKITFEYGKVTQIEFQPENSPLEFKYDLLYYVPNKLKGKKNLKTLIFLHGGGNSTRTRSGSLNVTNLYMNDLKTIADELGIIVVTPSGSGLNWSAHLLNMLRQLNLEIRKNPEVDPNGIALSGHSMGGMGITRSAQWLADEYAFFMPTAAGMDPKYAVTKYLKTYFNFKYLSLIHI